MGEEIEFRRSDGTIFQSKIAGIPLGGGYNPGRAFDFSVPRGTEKGEIELGCEVWSVK